MQLKKFGGGVQETLTEESQKAEEEILTEEAQEAEEEIVAEEIQEVEEEIVAEEAQEAEEEIVAEETQEVEETIIEKEIVVEDEALKTTFTEGKAIASKITANTLIEGSILTGEESDWYKFTTVDYTSCYTFTLNNTSDNSYEYVHLNVYNEEGSRVADNSYIDGGESSSCSVKLDRNAEYYIKINSSREEMSYSFKYTVSIDEPDVKEDVSVNLIENIQNKATICVDEDVDWYKLVTKNIDLEYEISFTNESIGTAVLAVYDKMGAKIVDTGYVGAEKNDTFTVELDKNKTYYVKVYPILAYLEKHTGSYNFTVTPITEWPFNDVVVNPGNWKYEAVKYAYENGIMTGTKSDEFAPDEPLTRAMFATMLYRMAGQPAVKYTNKFPDVPDGIWYSNAVIWASENGIVSGYGSGKFGTKDYITREQISKMLMEYGKKQGYDVDQRADFKSFADGESVSGWANDYMKWAVGSGMISGSQKDGKYYLNPRGNATRAESATMLKRFMEKYE